MLANFETGVRYQMYAALALMILGTQAGQTHTLRGLGVTHLHGSGRGDLVVHADVRTPTKVTAEQAELLRQLAALRGEEAPEGRLAAADKGFTAVRHQREVGTGYFDSVTQTIQRGQSSTTALSGSTEEEQFSEEKRAAA